jgi:putative transposase
MAVGSFAIGQRLSIGDVTCRLVRNLGKGQWQVEELSTGRIREETTEHLLSLWSKGDMRFAEEMVVKNKESKIDMSALDKAYEDAFLQSYPDDLLKRAKEKLIFIQKLGSAPTTNQVLTPLIGEIWERISKTAQGSVFSSAPHFTTVAAWRRIYRQAGADIRALVDRHHEKGNINNRVDQIVATITDDAIDTIYMTLERKTIQEVCRAVKGLVAKRNLGRLESEKLQAPSFAYVKRRISEIPEFDKLCARYGKRLADIRFRAAGRGVPTKKPLERACLDHCRLDLMVVDEATGLPLGRPWLTLALDEHTRYVLGFYLGFEEPSAVSVARALRHALMPKVDQLAQHPNVANTWDAWGVISLLAIDNGLELHCKAVEAGASRFGTILQFCPRKKPWYKGKIERHFGTLGTSLISTMPGKTFSNVLEKADYDPSDHAVIKLSTLQEILLTWIVDIYHQQRHRGIGKTPAQAWHEGMKDVEQLLPSSSLSVDSAFSRAENRRLTHKGIEFDSLLYNSQDLRVVREQFGSEIDVEVRVMDDDLGSIVVVVPGGEQLVRVPALEIEYAQGLTRWQHKVCRRYQRRLYDDESKVIGLHDAKERIRDLIAADMGLVKRKSRKRQARFMETTRPSIPSRLDTNREPSIALSASGTETPLLPKQALSHPTNSVQPLEDDIPALGSRRVRN